MPAGRPGGRDRVSGAVLQQTDAGWALRPFSVARLAELPRVIGLKDVSGDAMRPVRLRLGMDFRLPCGDDAGALAHLAQGGDGCISVTSNVAPGLCRNMYPAWKHGQSVRAQRLARPVAELTATLFRESNPVPVKHALALLGLMSPAVRLPLVELSNQHRAELRDMPSKSSTNWRATT